MNSSFQFKTEEITRVREPWLALLFYVAILCLVAFVGMLDEWLSPLTRVIVCVVGGAVTSLIFSKLFDFE